MNTLTENVKRVLLLLAESVELCDSILLMSIELDIKEEDVEDALGNLEQAGLVKNIRDVYCVTHQGIINATKIKKENRKEF